MKSSKTKSRSPKKRHSPGNSVISIRTSTHSRARGLGLSGHRPCRVCGNKIGFARRDGRWKPVEAEGILQQDGRTPASSA